MSECHCHYGEEPARVYRARRLIARIAHQCDECGGQIAPGDRYERVEALYWRSWSTYRTCSGCLMIRDHLAATRPCFCWYHGNMLEDAMSELDNGWTLRDGRYVDTFRPGERFRALALIVQARRERRKFRE